MCFWCKTTVPAPAPKAAAPPVSRDRSIDVRAAVLPYPPEGDAPVLMLCCEHDDHRPSLAVYRKGIKCYACGFHLWDSAAAVRYLRAHYPVPAPVQVCRGTTAARREVRPADIAIWEDILWHVRHERLSWLYARGLASDTVRRARLGHTGTRFTIPVLDTAGLPLTIRTRADPAFETEPRYSSLAGHGVFLYPLHLLAAEAEQVSTLYLCEGELDALRLWQEGLPAVAACGSANLARVVPQLAHIPQLAKAPCLVVCADQDDVGRASALAACCRAKQMGTFGQVQRMLWPRAAGKDITEFLQQHSLEEVRYAG